MKIYIVIIEVSIPWVGMQLGKNGGFCVSMKNLSLFYRLHIKKKKAQCRESACNSNPGDAEASRSLGLSGQPTYSMR